MRTKSFTNRKSRNRVLVAEALESRALMAADVLHNFLVPRDVNDDGSVTPIDALMVINRLNRTDDSVSSEREFHDVDDDSRLTPLDALGVINAINSQRSQPNQETHQGSNVSGIHRVRARVELETEGFETELKIRVDQAPASQSFEVFLNDIAIGQIGTDLRGRGEIVLSRGDDNSNHLPLPDSLLALSPEMELVIGDIVRGPLANVIRVEDRTSPPSDDADDHSSGSNDHGSASNSMNLVASFSVEAGVQRSAEYEHETEHGSLKRKFKAEIEKALPDTVYEVSVNGIAVGKITTDARGKGSLRLTSHPDDARDLEMPSDFPQVDLGAIVGIGAVSAPLL